MVVKENRPRVSRLCNVLDDMRQRRLRNIARRVGLLLRQRLKRRAEPVHVDVIAQFFDHIIQLEEAQPLPVCRSEN